MQSFALDLSTIALGQILDLRERRLDHEEAFTEIQKAADEQRRTLDRQVDLIVR